MYAPALHNRQALFVTDISSPWIEDGGKVVSRSPINIMRYQSLTQQVSFFVYDKNEADLKYISENYLFRNKKQVFAFIQENPYLIDLLVDAYQKIQYFFSSCTEVFLQIVGEPESSNDKQLIAWISLSLNPDEAIARLDQFDEEWWLDEMERAQDKLCFTIEFQ
jgi:hypothetical protein